VNTTFSTNALDTSTCPTDPDRIIIVDSIHFGVGLLLVYNQNVTGAEEERIIHVTRGDPNVLVGGFIREDLCFYVRSPDPLLKNESYFGLDLFCTLYEDRECLSTANFLISVESLKRTGIAYYIGSVDNNASTPTLSLSHSVPVGINSTIVVRPSSSVRFSFKSKINYWKQFWSEMSILLESVDTDSQVEKIFTMSRILFDANPTVMEGVYDMTDSNRNYFIFSAAACNWEQTVDMIQSIFTYLAFFGTFAIGTVTCMPSFLEFLTRFYLHLRYRLWGYRPH